MKYSMANILTILTGFGLIMFYTYYRFVCWQLPITIPIRSHILSLIFIICLYPFTVLTLSINGGKLKMAYKFLSDTFFFPLISFDNYLKENYYLNYLYEKVIIFFCKSIKLIMQSRYNYYILFTYFLIFSILTRIVLISVLSYDIFILHEFFYFYKMIPIGMLILIDKYFIYTIKKSMEDYIITINSMIDNVVYDLPEEDLLTFSSIEVFLEKQLEYTTQVNSSHLFDSSPIMKHQIYSNYLEENNRSKDTNLSKEERDIIRKEPKRLIFQVQMLFLFIEIIKAFHILSLIRLIKAFIFFVYFCVWSYILYVSFDLHKIYEEINTYFT